MIIREFVVPDLIEFLCEVYVSLACWDVSITRTYKRVLSTDFVINDNTSSCLL